MGTGRKTTGAVALLTAALLTGCASGGAAAIPDSASAQPTTAITATTTPTPTPTKTIDLNDPSTWLIDFNGVGPLTIGGNIDAEKASMAFFTDATNPAACPAAVFEADRTPGIVAQPGADGTTAMLIVNGNGHPSALAAGSPRTATGIGIGSTRQQLLAAYPGIAPSGSYSFVTYYAVQDVTGGWIDFSVGEGLVRAITVMDGPVPPSEYCG